MIKAKPEDFLVEERADLALHPRGEYRVYLLRKSHWTTLDLIHHLSRQFGLPPGRFSYGGKKDKHGLTSQFITIQDNRDFSTRARDFSLVSCGFMDGPMAPRLVQGNAFRVTIRNLMSRGVFIEGIHFTRLTGRPIFLWSRVEQLLKEGKNGRKGQGCPDSI